MSKNRKKINYIVKLTRVMDEGERRYSDKINHKEYAKTKYVRQGNQSSKRVAR